MGKKKEKVSEAKGKLVFKGGILVEYFFNGHHVHGLRRGMTEKNAKLCVSEENWTQSMSQGDATNRTVFYRRTPIVTIRHKTLR